MIVKLTNSLLSQAAEQVCKEELDSSSIKRVYRSLDYLIQYSHLYKLYILAFLSTKQRRCIVIYYLYSNLSILTWNIVFLMVIVNYSANSPEQLVLLQTALYLAHK